MNIGGMVVQEGAKGKKSRSLDAYKKLHEATAVNKGCLDAFMNARTLTRARGILFGFKSKNGARRG